MLNGDEIRNKVKELKTKGYSYCLFWNAAGMTKINFYNFTGGKIKLKPHELIALNNFIETLEGK